MASINDQINMMAKIGENSGGNIPGLDFDTIVTGMAKANAELNDALQQAKTPEDRQTIIDRFVVTVKPLIVENIAVIKSSYTTVKDGIVQLTENVTAAIATIIIPPAISVPPAAPNPAWSLLEAKQKVNSFQAICTLLLNAFLQLLGAATKIGFVVPAAVLALLDQITNVQKVINTIPV